MYSYQNKVVLITGGASGIGYLMGLGALQRGAKKLIVWDINVGNLRKAAGLFSREGFSIITQRVDVSDSEQVQRAAAEILQEVNSIDFLFNNAGIVVGKKFEAHSMEDIKKTMDVNIKGMMYVARAFLPAMLREKKGYLINIASAAGLMPNPGMTVYAASKWAAVGWSESLKLELELAGEPVKVLTVMPSYINTGMFAGVKAPLLTPLLEPGEIATKILNAAERGKSKLREPFMVKLTPFIRGVLPARIYDFVAGKIFSVYNSMDTFTGREEEN